MKRRTLAILLLGLIAGSIEAAFPDDHFRIDLPSPSVNGQASVGYPATPGIETLGHKPDTDEGRQLSTGQITVQHWTANQKEPTKLFSVVSGEWNAKDQTSRLIVTNHIPIVLKGHAHQRVTLTYDGREVLAAYPPIYLKPGSWTIRVGVVEKEQ